MKKAEFDKFADEYYELHSANIRLSGESPDFFAEYMRDTTKFTIIGTSAGRHRRHDIKKPLLR